MADESYNVMLDPSMFLTLGANQERDLEVRMNQISALAREGMEMYIPRAFMAFLEDHHVAGDAILPGGAWEGWIAIYGESHRAPNPPLERIYSAMSERAELIRPFRPDRRMQEAHQEFGEDLRSTFQVGQDSRLVECVLQEWIFLQERSWIVAQVRKAFDRMTKAGSVVLEIASRKILNKVIRKTRGKEEEEAITTLDTLLTLGKWVAAGGGAVAAGGIITLPPALAITLAISPRFFALIDP